jgi:tetratricopeptide (TPR) repeat protein
VPTEEELWHLLAEARDMPYGAGQIALIEQVIQHADAAGVDEVRFAGRMFATHAYTHGGEPAKAFVTFSWCLGEYDREPGRRSREDERLLLWHFKYVTNALTAFPEVPLARTYAVVDDMERRYRAGGYSLHAVHRQRWGIANHVGDIDAAEEWYTRWCAAPRDQNSDCEGCDPGAKVTHLVETGRDEDAIVLAEPVLQRRLTCPEQPQSILTDLLLPYLRTGRLAEAADAHRRAYRAMRGNLADLGTIADHLMFCAWTGNEARGLEIVQRHLGWLDRSPSPWATMRFAAAAARVLDGLVAAGHADLTVRRGADDVPVSRLAAELAGTARDLGARFDTRNGTDRQGARVAHWLAAEPLVAYLPLSAVEARVSESSRRAGSPRAAFARTPRPPAQPAGSGAGTPAGSGAGTPAGSGAGTPAGSGAGTPAWVPVRAPADYPDDPAELLDLAERLFREHRTPKAEAVWRHFDERYPADTLSPLLAARRIDGRGLVAAGAERHAEAEAAWREAADGYARAGDEVRRQVTLSRLGTLLCATDRYPEGLAMVEESTRELLDCPDAERRLGAELRLAYALGLGHRPGDALAAVERATAHADAIPADATDPLLAAELAMRRAQFLLVLGRAAEAAVSANAARERYESVGDPPVAALAWLLYAHALADSGDQAGAADAFGAALARSSEPDVVLSGQHGRGRALLADGDPRRAVAPLVESVAGFVAAGNDPAAAFARFDLATAYHGGGQPLDAAEAAEEALPVLEQLGAQDAADRCRYLLSLVYRDLDQPDEALTLLDQLVTNLDGYDNLPGRSQMHEEAGQVLYELDRDAAAAHRFAAAADGYRDAGLVLDEVRARRWAALALRWAEEPDQAIVTLVTAEESAATLPTDDPSSAWERAMLAFDGARVFVGAGRLDEAFDRSVASGDGFRSIGAFGEALQADHLRAELLLRLGRADEAEPVLRAVLGAAPRDSPARENGAWLLTEVLTTLGRDDEAAAIREEYGLDPT